MCAGENVLIAEMCCDSSKLMLQRASRGVFRPVWKKGMISLMIKNNENFIKNFLDL